MIGPRIFLLPLLAFALYAQSRLPPGAVTISGSPYMPGPRYQAGASLVQLTVRVSNSRGQPVTGLSEAAFTLLDDGKPQPIASFSEQVGTRAGSGSAATSSGGAVGPVNVPAGTAMPAPGQTPAARSIELYFDDLHTDRNDMQAVRKAATAFVQSDVQPKDRVGVYTASMVVTSPIGLDRAATVAALAKLAPHLHMELQGDVGDCPRLTPDEAYKIDQVHDPTAFTTALAQAAICNCINTGNNNKGCGAAQVSIVHAMASATWFRAENQTQATLETIENAIAQLARAPAPRLLVIGSAGFLTGTFDYPVQQLVQSALREDVMIDSLDAQGLVVGDRPWGDSVADMEPDLDPIELMQALSLISGPDVEAASALATGFPTYDMSHTGELIDLTDGMSALAKGTGGQLFWNSNDLTAGYVQVTAPPAAYLLAFAPALNHRDGKFHQLQVKVSDTAAAHVKTRAGYYAAAELPAVTPANPLDAAMLGAARPAGIPVQVVTEAAPVANGNAALRIGIAIDIGRLPFQQQEGHSTDNLAFAAVLFNAAGEAVTGKQAILQMRLDAEALATLARDGIHTSMTLSAAPGSYRLRQVVREGNAGLLSVSDSPVTLK